MWGRESGWNFKNVKRGKKSAFKVLCPSQPSEDKCLQRFLYHQEFLKSGNSSPATSFPKLQPVREKYIQLLIDHLFSGYCL